MDINLIVGYQDHICIECGATFFMPETLDRQRKKDRKSFYCPNGHAQSYSESLSDRLERQLKAKDEELVRLKKLNIDLKSGLEARERELVRLSKKVKGKKKVKGA